MTNVPARGLPEPWGVTPVDGGVNVAVFSAHAEAIELCLFDERGERETARVALPARTGDVWHAFVPRVGVGTRYGLRARGPFDPSRGHRFDATKLLVDPWARALDRAFALHPSMFSLAPDGTRSDADSAPHVPKGVVVAAPSPQSGASFSIPWPDTVLYELHVRGFTMRHPRVPPSLRGTFAALAEPAVLEHLVRLGVTSVELLPVAAWIDERHLAALGRANYWGYNPVAMGVPDARLAPGGIAEVARTVAALHAAGIEVILDVVFNHTGEGDALGPTVSFRGLDNASWYRLRADDRSRYVDDAGCGNVLACDRPHVVRLVLDALRHWVLAANVDGFRFDLGTTLGRSAAGFDPAGPLLSAIAQDPLLATRKLIAEPWDLGPGGYQLGAFPGTWGEWNDRYRDAVRRFFRGDPGLRGEMATRLAGSADVLGPRSRPLSRSVNFVTAHDGFTLADLVSYAAKHNEANGEGNRDGTDRNDSWNHGVEGPADDPAIRAMRGQDVRSMLAALAFSRGTPMLSMGDELGRTQHGNNNAYAQDGPLAWVDWEGADHGLTAFVARVLALRAAHPALRAEAPLTGAPNDDSGVPDVQWRRADGEPLEERDWRDPEGRTLIASLCAPADAAHPADRVVVVLHAGPGAVDVRLPDPRDVHAWHRAADSAAPGIDDEPVDVDVAIAARSVVLFVERPSTDRAHRRHGIEPDVLRRLSTAAGIATEWWDLAGTRHASSPDTLRALLASVGLAVDTTSDARARLVALAERSRRMLPQAVVVAANRGGEVSLPLGARPAASLLLTREDGSCERIVADLSAARTVAHLAADGRTTTRAIVALPPLPAGVHALAVEDDAGGSRCAIVATPGRCHLPSVIRDGRRAFGVAVHLYSLRRPGDHGIGDFAALADLADASGRRGAVTIGLNPLHALFAQERDRASPYHPSDRRFLDPIYLDVEQVPDFSKSPEARACLAALGNRVAALRAVTHVDYPGVWSAKRAVLDMCHRAFRARRGDDPLRDDYARFVADGGEALQRFARFEAIAAAHPRTPWYAWPEGLRSPEARDVATFADRHAQDVEFALYLQWLADRQLGEVAGAARAAGLSIGLYRDLAVGAAPDGAEVWADPAGFAHGVSVGAPPDPFAPDGQVWCLPPLNPLALDEGGYARFRGLVAANLRHAGALRIDHAMGLARLFYVPDGARAVDGAYVEYPLEALLGALALESARAGAMIVGEDLGTVPEGLRERLDDANVFSSVVVWLERDGSVFRPPGRWRRKSVASVSTHDLPTVAGWWRGADIDERAQVQPASIAADEARVERGHDRERLAELLVRENVLDAQATADEAAIASSLHRLLASSPAPLVLVQADDLAGESEALNLPGTDRERPNWRRRLSVDAGSLWSTPIGEAAADALGERRPDAEATD